MDDHRAGTNSLGVRTLMGSGLGACVVVLTLWFTAASASAAWTVNLAALSSAQAASAAAPAPPTGVTAACTSGTTQTVKVSWTASPRASSYAVYDSVTGANGAYLLMGSASSSPYTTATLTIGLTYYFKVVAQSGSAWTSGFSAATAGRAIGLGSCS